MRPERIAVAKRLIEQTDPKQSPVHQDTYNVGQRLPGLENMKSEMMVAEIVISSLTPNRPHQLCFAPKNDKTMNLVLTIKKKS